MKFNHKIGLFFGILIGILAVVGIGAVTAHNISGLWVDGALVLENATTGADVVEIDADGITASQPITGTTFSGTSGVFTALTAGSDLLAKGSASVADGKTSVTITVAGTLPGDIPIAVIMSDPSTAPLSVESAIPTTDSLAVKLTGTVGTTTTVAYQVWQAQ